MIRKILFTALLFAGSCVSLCAQSKIFLYAVDENKEPLDMVGITIADDKQEYLNQTVMYFPYSIELGKGTYYITATKYGFLQNTDTVTITEPEQIFTVKLTKVAETVTLGAVKAAPQNLQSGSVYTVDREFIEACGARDLVDVLMAIPGFSMGVDVLGNINNATRGVWTNEGKFMVMMDGIMLNELAYGTMQLGQRFPIDNIERIEILRGPASLTNGGLASYGVLNIITRKHTDGEQVTFGTLIGKSDDAIMRQGYNLMYNKKTSEHSFINASGYIARGQRSDRTFTDFSGNAYSMNGNSDISNEQLLVNAGYKGFRFTGMLDNYHYFQGDAYGLNSQRAYPIRYPVAGFQAYTTIELNRNWKLTPLVGFLTQKPYSEKNVIIDSIDLADIGRSTIFDFTTINRLTNNFTLSYTSGKRVDFDFKGEYLQDFFKNNEELFPNKLNTFEMSSVIGVGSMRISVLDPVRINQNQAFYLQGAVRAEKQTYYSAIVPQFSATMLTGIFHSKLLFGRSFRSPLMENIRLNIENNGGDFTLKPEYTNTFELELGLDFNPKNSIGLNIYNNKTTGVITFITDALGNENYANGSNIGTTGLELHSRFQGDYVSLYFNGNYYQAAAGDSTYLVPDKKVNLGIPALKFNSIISLNLQNIMGIKNTHLNLTYTYLDRQFGYIKSAGTIESEDGKNYLSTILDFKNIKQSGLRFSIGIYDILNQGMLYVQPYNGGHAALPGTGREYVIRLVYNLMVK